MLRDLVNLAATVGANRFKGKYTSLANLQLAHPTSSDGDYAIVDAGVGINAIEYIWDTDEGWVQGNSMGASTTDALPEGSVNFYFTLVRVLSTALSGLSLVTGGAIVSTDSILVAFGKIQKQITDNIASIILKQDISNQVSVSTSQNVQNSWHGKTIVISGNCTLTVPSSFTNSGMAFEFIVKNGFTVTWAITSPKVWGNGTPVPTVGTSTYVIGTFMQEDGTNSIMLLGV